MLSYTEKKESPWMDKNLRGGIFEEMVLKRGKKTDSKKKS
jgi:hypothetical protein